MLLSWIARVLLIACFGWLALPFELVAHPATLTTAIDEKERRLFEVQRDIAVLKEATRLRLEAQETRLQKDLQHLQLRIEEQDAQFAAQLAAQLEAQKESLQKDLHELQSRIEQQDGQLADIHAETGRLHMFLAILASFLTLLVAATGVATWYSAGARARDTVQAWIAQHESERNAGGREALSEIRADVVSVSHALLVAARGMAAWYSAGTKMQEAAQEAAEARMARKESESNAAAREAASQAAADAAKASQTIQAGLDEIAAKAEQVALQLQKKLTETAPVAPTPEQVEVLDAQERHLKQKPENDYTFSDWESRAYAAYSAKQFDLASNYFFQASKVAATPEQEARAQVARGVMLAEMNRSEEAIGAYEYVVTNFGEATEPTLREQVVKAWLNKGVALGRLTRNAEALAAYEQVIMHFGEATEPVLREQVAKAWLNKGATLGRLTRSEEAITAYEQVVIRFGEATDSVLREQVAKALFNKGVALGRLTRSAEALAAYEQVVIRFGEATEPVLREQVVKALLNKGVALGRLTRSVEAIAAYEEVISRFGEAAEPVLREGVAKALVNKGVTLGRLARYEEAIAAYDQVVARFGMAPELSLREGVAKVLVNKGVALDRLGRSEEAAAVYEDVVARFGEATEPSLREQVTRTFNSMGLHLLRQAKLSWDDREARTQLLAAARVSFDRVLEREAQNASTLGNLGYLLFLSGQPDQAMESLQYALTLGGEELYRDMVKDAETDTVPEDAEFRALLDRIWLED